MKKIILFGIAAIVAIALAASAMTNTTVLQMKGDLATLMEYAITTFGGHKNSLIMRVHVGENKDDVTLESVTVVPKDSTVEE